MPRTRKTPPPPNSVVASAARLTTRNSQGRPAQTGSQAWQTEAWLMLDEVGELEFYRAWICNALSRCTLKLTVEDPSTGDVSEVTDGPAAAALDELFGGEAGQSQMLAALAAHLSFPGESWLVGIVEPDLANADAPDQWRVLAVDEITEQGDRWQIDRGDGRQETYSKGNPETGEGAELLVIRIWRPHPRKWVEATSSVRSALPILRELRGLTEKVAADVDSRLAGNGILFVPSEATFSSPNPQPDGSEGDPIDPMTDPLMATLIDGMITPMRNRESASAVVPIVAKVPGEYIKYIQHLTFSTPLDDKAQGLRTEAIQRLANSLDVPAEVLTGMADVNHWTGWLLDENAIKMHVEPLLELIAHALTTRYIWPAMQAGAAQLPPEARLTSLLGDTSALRQRQDKSQSAQFLWEALIITDDALARESGGFTGDDLLVVGSEEWKRRMLAKVAEGGTTPDTVIAALNMLGLNLPAAPATTPDASSPAEVTDPGAPPAIGGKTAPRNPPEQPKGPPVHAGSPDAFRVALVLASEATLRRALERAWNRYGKRSRTGRRPLAVEQLDPALVGAWDYLPRVAAMTGVDEGALRACLDRYARTLLTTGEELTPVTLVRLLEELMPSEDEARSA